MIDPELQAVMDQLTRAKSPEDVFGGGVKGFADTDSLASLRRVYRRLARTVHPDKYSGDEDREMATAAFKLLEGFWKSAQLRLGLGIYGSPTTAVITTRKYTYEVGARIATGDIADVYAATNAEGHIILKAARSHVDNDLMANEARTLRLIDGCTTEPGYRAYVPQLVESFGYRDGSQPIRQVNTFEAIEGLHSLAEVKAQYPHTVGAKHAAWMWTRLLLALDIAHKAGVVHGAVLPPHVLVHPAQHGLVLVDWTNATHDPEVSGERVKMISKEYEKWYPPEVIKKEEPTPGMDILMGARCMVYLLGGDPLRGTLPDTIAPQLRNFFRACMFESPRMRPQDAGKLREEFHELIELLWGRRQFVTFSMA